MPTWYINIHTIHTFDTCTFTLCISHPYAYFKIISKYMATKYL